MYLIRVGASFVLILCLGCLVSLANDQPQAASATKPTKQPYFWIFLTSGKSTASVDRVEIEKMQAAHLSNFGRLHGEGKLFMAGPLSDPDKNLRGIVVVTAMDAASVPKLFESDPYVTNGYLQVDSIEMDIAIGEFQRNVDPQSMAEYRMVLLERSSKSIEASTDEVAKNLVYCKSIHDGKHLCFVGWFNDNKSARRGVMLFRKMDDAKLEEMIAELPSIKSTTWRAKKIPLFMSDGIIK
ncbi:MAG: YciI family protein [Pirellula sp.]